MDIDFSGARGSFQYTPKGKPGPEGLHGNLKISVKVEINAPLDFLDKYMAGHLTGAQPSSVFWKEMDPGNPDTEAVPRYMSMKRMELEVSEDRRYGFRIKAPPPEGWAQGELWRGAEVSLLPCQIKKLVASPTVNGVLLSITFTLEHQQSGVAAELAALVVLEEVIVDAWLSNRDLEGTGNPLETRGPRDRDDDEHPDPDAQNPPQEEGGGTEGVPE